MALLVFSVPLLAQENCTNGIDDDGNGYVDDIHGWDFMHMDNTIANQLVFSYNMHMSSKYP